MVSLAPVSTSGADSDEPMLRLTLASLEEERRHPTRQPPRPVAGGLESGPSRQHVNLYVLVSAHPNEDYMEQLKAIAAAKSFLRSGLALTPAQHPGMAPGLDRLTVETIATNYDQMNHLWGALGGKMTPSFLVRVRGVELVNDEEPVVVSEVKEVVLDGGS